MVARKGAVVLASAVLLLAVVITVNHDVRYHTSLPTASSSELLGVPAGAKAHSKGQAALKSNALVAKLEAVDVGGALSPAVVQKLAEKMVKVPKSSESKAEAVKAAEDITKVITDGKLDDESVKSVLADSRTHHGKDSGSTLLFRELHQEASSKKGKASVSLSADISSALDVGKAKSKKQIKMAQTEALTIAKVLQQSKEDLGEGKAIYHHSKTKGGTKNWDNFWNTKHSLVTRLAAEEGVKKSGALASGKGKKVVSKRESAKEAEEAQTKAAAQKAKLAQVPAAVRKMWALLDAAKAAKQ